MSDGFTTTQEYRQLKDRWYNNLQRAHDDLAELKPENFPDSTSFLLRVTQLQAEIKVLKDCIDEVDTYFKPDALPKSRPQ